VKDGLKRSAVKSKYLKSKKMATYGKLNSNNEIEDVLCVSEELLDDVSTLKDIVLGKLKKLPEEVGIGYIWNENLNSFISPKPYPSWILNTTTLKWESPIGNPPELTEEQIIRTTSGYALSGYTWDEEAYQADNTTGWQLQIPEYNP